MPDPQNQITQSQPTEPPAPWTHRDPVAMGGEDNKIELVWSWDDADEGEEHYIAIDGDLLCLGTTQDDGEELAQEMIELGALETFLRAAGWTVERPK